MRGAFVYIMTNKYRNVFYTGVTSNLEKRVSEHKYNPNGFVKKYKTSILVFHSDFSSILQAIEAEKYIKGKNRKWKIALISKENPFMLDLSE